MEGRSSLPEQIKQFTSKVKFWNKQIFGNIFHRKSRYLARIKGLQTLLASERSDFHSQLEKSLVGEYNTHLKTRKSFLRQKSMVKWLSEGEGNTHFSI